MFESASFFTAPSSLSCSNREMSVATEPAVPLCAPAVINRESSSSKYGDLTSIRPCSTSQQQINMIGWTIITGSKKVNKSITREYYTNSNSNLIQAQIKQTCPSLHTFYNKLCFYITSVSGFEHHDDGSQRHFCISVKFQSLGDVEETCTHCRAEKKINPCIKLYIYIKNYILLLMLLQKWAAYRHCACVCENSDQQRI